MQVMWVYGGEKKKGAGGFIVREVAGTLMIY
jgi:hypothetical protein